MRSPFRISSRQKNGYLQLALLILVFLFSKYAYHKLTPKPSIRIEDISIDSLLLESFITSVDSPSITQDSLFLFDPNIVSRSELKLLGFEDEIANRIIKYRTKGGSFYSSHDLKKIYGVEEEFYNHISDYIRIMQRGTLTENPRIQVNAVMDSSSSLVSQQELMEYRATRSIKLNLNQVDSLQLLQVKGIGPILSSRIIRYREMLGGYTYVDQLKEVYNMSDDGYGELVKYCYIDSDFSPQRLSINHDEFKTLLRHPYMNYNLVKNIFTYRNQHGEYNSIEELKNLYFITDSLFQKVKPYISL